MIKEHTFILKIKTNNSEWKKHLNIMLNQFCQETNSRIAVYELNKKGTQKAEELLK